jgi:hypothetical protein
MKNRFNYLIKKMTIKILNMKKIFLQLIMVFSIMNVFAQTETFDIATFTPPQGWQRIDSNGAVLFHDYRAENGLTSFCQIFLYPSRAGDNDAQKNFQAEWKNRVVRTTGTREKPKTATEQTPDGWTAVTGYTNITKQGVTYTCMLVSASGFGKVMSIMINIAGQAYIADVQNFLNKFELNANTMITPNPNNQQTQQTQQTSLPATPGSLSDYVYEVPAGWTIAQLPDGIVLSENAEKCRMVMMPMRPAGNNLANDAAAIFSEVFKSVQLKRGSTAPSMVRGVSPQGWEYYIIKNGMSQPGNDFTFWGFLFVAKLGNQLAPIWGQSKDPLVSACFGMQLTDVWPQFFYSLHFKNWNNTGQESSLLKQLPGVWVTAIGSVSDRWAFAPNGRFAGTAASQRYSRTSSTEVMRVTDAYWGDGSYFVQDNSISLVHDSDKSNPENGLFRIEQESLDGGRTWKEKLYLVRKSDANGAAYEVNYDKQ